MERYALQEGRKTKNIGHEAIITVVKKGYELDLVTTILIEAPIARAIEILRVISCSFAAVVIFRTPLAASQLMGKPPETTHSVR